METIEQAQNRLETTPEGRNGFFRGVLWAKNSDEEVLKWKAKAEKYDNLEKKIDACYLTEQEDISEDEPNLLTIGEIAAIEFGWM